MRISDWSLDVCSSDLAVMQLIDLVTAYVTMQRSLGFRFKAADRLLRQFAREMGSVGIDDVRPDAVVAFLQGAGPVTATWRLKRSEEHTSELQSLMRISYAVFCLKKKKNTI